MLRNLMRKLAFKIIDYCKKRDKIFIITGSAVDGKSQPYLVRYLLFNNRFFSVFVHRFLRSDHDGPHDHPFSFFSYIIDGGYTEEQYKPYIKYPNNFHYIEPVRGKTDFIIINKKRKAGSLAYKSSKDVHKVILDKEYVLEEKEQAPLTICIIGPRVRDWGFWSGKERYSRLFKERHYLGKWILWTEFLGIKPDAEKRG